MNSLSACAENTQFSKSEVFNARYLPFGHLFNSSDASVIDCVTCEPKCAKRVVVSVQDNIQNAWLSDTISTASGAGFDHPNLTKLYETFVDETVGKRFIVSEYPTNACSVDDYVKFSICHNEAVLRKTVHSAMKQMLKILNDLSAGNCTLTEVPKGSVMLVEQEDGFKLIFMRDLLRDSTVICDYEPSDALLDVASMFSQLYGHYDDECRLTQPEHYFFLALRRGLDLKRVETSPYIQSDPDTWTLEDLTWEQPLKKWAICLGNYSNPENCDCDVCTGYYESSILTDPLGVLDAARRRGSHYKAENEYWPDEAKVDTEVRSEYAFEHAAGSGSCDDDALSGHTALEPEDEEVRSEYAYENNSQYWSGDKNDGESVHTSDDEVEEPEVRSEYAFKYYPDDWSDNEEDDNAVEGDDGQSVHTSDDEVEDEEVCSEYAFNGNADDDAISVHTAIEKDDDAVSVHTAIGEDDDDAISVHTAIEENDDAVSVHTAVEDNDDAISVHTAVEEDDDAVSVHTAIEDDDDAVSVHTAIGEDDDDVVSVHTAIQEESTPAPHFFNDECQVSNADKKTYDPTLAIMSVEDYIYRLAEDNNIRDGETKFGFRVRNLGLFCIVKSDEPRMTIEVVDAFCTYFGMKSQPESAMALIFDGEELVAVQNEGQTYYHFTSLPTYVVNWLCAARIMINDIYDNQVLLTVYFDKICAHMIMRCDGMVTLRCDQYDEVIFSPMQMDDVTWGLFQNDAAYGDALKQFMRLPLNINKETLIELF